MAYGCVEDVWNGVVGVAVNCNEGDSDGVCKKCALPSISCAVTETAANADKTMEDQILHCVIAFILHWALQRMAMMKWREDKDGSGLSEEEEREEHTDTDWITAEDVSSGACPPIRLEERKLCRFRLPVCLGSYHVHWTPFRMQWNVVSTTVRAVFLCSNFYYFILRAPLWCDDDDGDYVPAADISCRSDDGLSVATLSFVYFVEQPRIQGMSDELSNTKLWRCSSCRFVAASVDSPAEWMRTTTAWLRLLVSLDLL